MGRQDGLIQLTGGVGNLSFYKSQDGYLVRKKSGVSRERIMSDRAYARTRENIAEFGRGALATKLLRRAFRSVIVTAADNRVTSRLTSAIMKVIKSDAINSRGQRNVADGDVTLLEGFEFNKNAALEKTFGAPFTATIDRATGNMRVNIPAFSPADVISAPEGATHFRLKAVGAALDFEANTYSIAESESAYLPIRQKMQAGLLLSHTVAPASVNPLLLAFGIEFVQLINGVHYPLKEDMFNAMAIVRVDGAGRVEFNTNDEDSEERKIIPVSPILNQVLTPEFLKQIAGTEFIHGTALCPMEQMPDGAMDSLILTMKTFLGRRAGLVNNYIVNFVLYEKSISRYKNSEGQSMGLEFVTMWTRHESIFTTTIHRLRRI